MSLPDTPLDSESELGTRGVCEAYFHELARPEQQVLHHFIALPSTLIGDFVRYVIELVLAEGNDRMFK